MEHLTVSVEYVMGMIFGHLCQLYDYDSMYEKLSAGGLPPGVLISGKFM